MKGKRKYLGKQVQHAVTELDLIEWTGGWIEVGLECSEFTSHCPVTKQPDFAKLVIKYRPNKHIVETKSFKLYLWQFRDVAEFNEKLVARIADDFVRQVKPYSVTVTGFFTVRGGIAVSAQALR